MVHEEIKVVIAIIKIISEKRAIHAHNMCVEDSCLRLVSLWPCPSPKQELGENVNLCEREFGPQRNRVLENGLLEGRETGRVAATRVFMSGVIDRRDES